MKNIKQIEYPNTVMDEAHYSYYTVGKNCDEIRPIDKNGEMANIAWLQIVKDNKVIAEIKESVCNIYGEDNLTPTL